MRYAAHQLLRFATIFRRDYLESVDEFTKESLVQRLKACSELLHFLAGGVRVEHLLVAEFKKQDGVGQNPSNLGLTTLTLMLVTLIFLNILMALIFEPG